MKQWWDKFYDTLSETEVCWETGMTPDEVKEEMANLVSSYEGYTVVRYIRAKDAEFNVLDDAGLADLVVVDYDGVEFLGQIVGEKLYDVGEEVRTTLCLDDDPGDDISVNSSTVLAYDDLSRIERQYGCYAEYQRCMDEREEEAAEREERRWQYYNKCQQEENEAIENGTFFAFPSDECYRCVNMTELGMTGPDDDFPKGSCPYCNDCRTYNDIAIHDHFVPKQ